MGHGDKDLMNEVASQISHIASVRSKILEAKLHNLNGLMEEADLLQKTLQELIIKLSAHYETLDRSHLN